MIAIFGDHKVFPLMTCGSCGGDMFSGYLEEMLVLTDAIIATKFAMD